jgi:hypothetical protein
MARETEEETKPIYEDREKGISVVPASHDPGAYHFLLGGRGANIYFHRNVLGGLARPEVSTAEVKRAVGAMTQEISNHILGDAGLTYEDLHIALLKVRVIEQEREISYRIDEKNRAAGLID